VGMRATTLITVLVVGLTACGDPATNDDRGYTKAPLEDPGLLVSGEAASPMAELGRANRPRAELAVEEQEEDGAAESPSQSGAQEEVVLAEGVTRERYDEGKALFAGQGGCQACHGPNGSGSQLAPDLTDAQWLHLSEPTVSALAEVITSGVAQPKEHPAPMPPMGGASLSPEQVDAIAAYVASIAVQG
jgi:mono/diheme cytochrome c family protein